MGTDSGLPSVADAMAPQGIHLPHQVAFAVPPIDGCSSMTPRVSRLGQQQGLRPGGRRASAASVPAWPPPTTMTSNRVGGAWGEMGGAGTRPEGSEIYVGG